MILPNGHKLTGRLFRPDMALANIEGRKTETRRNCSKTVFGDIDYGACKNGQLYWANKPCPWGKVGDWFYQKETFMYSDVQVSWDDDEQSTAQVLYKASNDIRPDGISVEDFGAAKWITVSTGKAEDIEDIIDSEEQDGERWKPSIHMQFEAARFFAQITEIRIELLWDITEQGAIDEGAVFWANNFAISSDKLKNQWAKMSRFIAIKRNEPEPPICTALGAYAALWENINGKRSWLENPFVWVIKYKGYTAEQFEAVVGTTIPELAKQIKRKGAAV